MANLTVVSLAEANLPVTRKILKFSFFFCVNICLSLFSPAFFHGLFYSVEELRISVYILLVLCPTPLLSLSFRVSAPYCYNSLVERASVLIQLWNKCDITE